MKIQQRPQLSDPSIFTAQGMSSFAANIMATRTDDPRPTSSLGSMLPPTSMLGLTKAAEIVANAIEKKSRIVIVADYDADGATACSIAMTGLKMFGAVVTYIVPNRFTEGYGLSPQVVDRARELKPELFITVDNGIAAHAGIEAAGKLGIPVLVTDHHLPGDTVPDAACIVNPNQHGCSFESKNLAGCGVAFYLIVALRAKYRALGDPRGALDLRPLLDILAIGTVADLVKLDHNNRVLVSAGLARIRQGLSRPGVNQLFKVAKRNPVTASCDDLAFYVGPRINSAGRMEDASVGISCLSTTDAGLAVALADTLHATNSERRLVQKSIEDDAFKNLPSQVTEDQVSICIFDPDYHEGVIGIVASKCKERFYRPSIVFTKVEDGCAKGSGRSIPGLHLRDTLDIIDKQRPGLIKRFGGHAMAAGLTIDLQRFEEFKQLFHDVCKSQLSPSDLGQITEHDGVLAPEHFDLANADWIANNVWGQAFPTPSFIIESPNIIRQTILKEAHLKLSLDIGGTPVDAIWFGKNQPLESSVDLLCKLSINEWNGKRSLQLMVDMQA